MKPILRTHSGRQVNPLDLQPEDIEIASIAHSLALVNRFVGHTRMPISVAQHSWYVSRLLDYHSDGDAYLALLGLCHDMTEAYLGDVSKWVKHTPEMDGYRACEDRAEQVIYAVMLPRLPMPQEHVALDWADRVMVRFEGMQGFGADFLIDHPRYPPLTMAELVAVGPWFPWTWREAERRFLRRFRALQNALQRGARADRAAGGSGVSTVPGIG